MLTIALLTIGDPDGLTGGHRYHRRIAAHLPALDARMVTFALPDRPPGLAALRAGAALAAVRRAGADALLLDSLAAAAAGPRLSLAAPRPPLVAMLHQPPGGIEGGALRRTAVARLDRLAYRRAARVLAASRALADEVVASGVAPASRVGVVPPGRDPVEPHPGPAGDLRQGRRCAVLCAANWLPRKGILELLDAVSRLPPDAVTLHLAGETAVDRRHAARIRGRLAAADLAGRVVVHGAMEQARLAAMYLDADVFALASVREPYGTVYGEALAAGLPVVGWRAGNLPHLADDGVEGLIVTPGDVGGLAAALRRLAEDEPLRRRLAAASARRGALLPRWKDSAALLVAGVRAALAAG